MQAEAQNYLMNWVCYIIGVEEETPGNGRECLGGLADGSRECWPETLAMTGCRLPVSTTQENVMNKKCKQPHVGHTGLKH